MEDDMAVQDIVGLLIGCAAFAAAIGFLVTVYLHPQRFGWLELPQDAKRERALLARRRHENASPVRQD
jgi:hypothetical protein